MRHLTALPARKAAMLLVLVGVLSITTAPARATAPVISPLEVTPIVFDAGEACPFAVRISPVRANEIISVWSDRGVAFISGLLVERYRNLDTGKMVVENISGPGRLVFHDDGGFTLVGTGPQGFALLPGDVGGPALLRILGHVKGEFAPDGRVTAFSAVGRVIDMCEVLS
jgi:hypothetical protein